MPIAGPIKVSQKPVKAYYEALASFANQKVKHETAIRAAFQTLLSETARKRGWTLILELASTGRGNARVVPDGTLRDEFLIPRGFWEAKDTDDDLDTERCAGTRIPSRSVFSGESLPLILIP